MDSFYFYDDHLDIYDKIFFDKTEKLGSVEHSVVRINPVSCSTKGTFFISHLNTSYVSVSKLHARGYEIGVNSITKNNNETYWTNGSYDDWLSEMAGQRLIVERFANITDGLVTSIQAPGLLVGGDTQFDMMEDQLFVMDASLVAPLSPTPYWPYTLYYKVWFASLFSFCLLFISLRSLTSARYRMVATVPQQVILCGRYLSTLSRLLVILAP